MRISRFNGASTYEYRYSGSQLRYMKVDGHTMLFEYDTNGLPLSVIFDGYVFFYITNLQGYVVAITDSTGERKVFYTYDAWGNITHAYDNSGRGLKDYNPLRYRSCPCSTQNIC